MAAIAAASSTAGMEIDSTSRTMNKGPQGSTATRSGTGSSRRLMDRATAVVENAAAAVTGSSSGAATAAVVRSELVDGTDQGHGHFFSKKTFHRPTYCHHCTDMLWGLIGQGYLCEVCNFVVHDRCLSGVVSPCSSIATSLIKNPVAHCWSEPGYFKSKFCNLCRRRLGDNLAVRCEICEYYAHVDCQDFAVSDCKECATGIFVPQKSTTTDAACSSDACIERIANMHHWREGNLSGNAKCMHCKKTCWSSECLAGMRCEWCGVTAHASCYKQLPEECSFGCLRDIFMPPYCVTVPRIDVPQEMLYRFPKKQTTEEYSSSGDSKTEDEVDKRSPKEKDGKDREREEEVVHVCDGNGSLRRWQHRSVSIPKHAPAQALLEAALRTFHISEDPSNFLITEAADLETTTERALDLTQPVFSQISSHVPGKRPIVFLRYNEQTPSGGLIRIYPKGLSEISQQANVTYCCIPAKKDTLVTEIIQVALKKLGIENADQSQFCLAEVMLDKGVSERELGDDEMPWQIVQNKRRESLRLSHMMRFYLKQKEDPHGPHIAIYVSNLPASLSQRQYQHILVNIVGQENKWSSIDVIYYEHGSLVLVYNNNERATRAFNSLQDATFDNKSLLVLLLPNIQPQMIPKDTIPLLVLVNVKSGGQQGMALIRSFRKLLNPHQVYDLMNGGPLPGLYVFRNVKEFKILVCGGDGTIGWALACLDNVGQDAKCQYPPMAIIPLGTGNDLARVLRWGPGYNGADEPLGLLRDIIDAEVVQLDRWTVIFHPNEKETGDELVRYDLATKMNTAQPNEDTTSIFLMNNYFGIGLDADVCLEFHRAREENPDKFNSRLHNKGVYFKLGMRKIVENRKSMNQVLRMEVDGKVVDLPPVEGIIILNILSWAGGANPWGPERDDQFQRPTHYDGMLEVVGVTGIIHMGQVQSGLRTAIRIAQGGHIKIDMFTDLPVQVDGEPWKQPAGQVVIIRSALKAYMLKKSKNKIKRCNTEPSLYFPNSGSEPESSRAVMLQPDGDSGPL